MSYLIMLKKYSMHIGMLILLGLAYYVINETYEMGYTAAKAEYTEELNNALINAQAQHEIDVKKALEIKEKDLKSAVVNTEEKIKIVTKTQKVIEYVDREIEVPAVCDDVSSYVVGMLSKTTAIVSGVAETSGE